MKIDDMRVGDFLYLIDTLQEECVSKRKCIMCRYHDICYNNDICSISTPDLKKAVEAYAEMNGMLDHMHYVNQKWIPVSEHLPEDLDNRFYMCILENHEDDLPMFLQFDDELGFGYWIDRFHPQTLGYLGDEFITTEDLEYEKVVAWMPLPNPYRGKEV